MLKICLVIIDILNSFKMLYKLFIVLLLRLMVNWDILLLDVGLFYMNGRLLVVS